MIETRKVTLHNFNAGPSVLPREVFQEASAAILNFKNSGPSILEIGHRTPLFEEVMEEARTLVRDLMQLDEEHEVLFLHGGATTQFMQVPMNLLAKDGFAAYTETGTWSEKAIKEARLFGHVEIVGSGKQENFTSLPKNVEVAGTAAYLHITTNETIAGTQWREIPFQQSVPLVADMSSDILSRVLDFNRFDLIYAGAQKNMGAAGVNLVVVRRSVLGRAERTIPSILDYKNHIQEKSMLNTPPVSAVYVAMLTLKWLKAQGGVPAIEQRNLAKAKLMYETIDENPVFQGMVAKEDRSMMNAVFRIDDNRLEKEFLDLSLRENMIGIQGHRSAGGFRVSMYNALGIDSVKAITDLMKNFAQKKG